MPLLYGEGDMAFIRLQQKIAETFDDQSQFAWSYIDKAIPGSTRHGIFATSPAALAQSEDIVPCDMGGNCTPFKRGLVHLPIL